MKRDIDILTGSQPQDGTILVMQLFRQAIRDVVCDLQREIQDCIADGSLVQATKHSFGAEQYWEWARIFSRLAHTDVDNGLSDLIVPFLDIGKEGELQGQIKSVLRDLQIMLHITKEQLEVFQKFEKCIQQFSGGKSTAGMEPLLAELRNCIQDLEDMGRTADGISTSVGSYPLRRKASTANNRAAGLSHLLEATASHRCASVAVHEGS